MRIRRRVLSAFAFAAAASLLTYSCITTDKSVGSDYIPDSHKLQVLTASIKLPVTLRSADSLQGVASTYISVGAFNTPEFGVARFGSAANITPSSTTIDFGNDAKIISTYLLLIRSEVSEDLTLPSTSIVFEESQKYIGQNINVYRLNKYLDTADVYVHSISENDYDHTPLNKADAVYFGGDTLKIYLDNALGSEILSATDEELDSLELFMKNHRGLYILPETPIAGTTGGRLNLFSRASASLYVKFNFQPTWDEGLDRKDTLVTLVFGSSYCVNTAQHSSKNRESTEELEQVPIEGIAGLTPYISASSLKERIDEWINENGYNNKKILVAKASMTFPYPEPALLDDYSYKYPKYLFPNHRLKLSDTTLVKYYYLFDDQYSNDNPMGEINRSLLQYTCDFSESTQQFIRKDKSELGSNYNIWISPVYSETNTLYGTITYYIDQYTYYMGSIYGPKAEKYPTLDIIYTIVD